MPKIRITTPRLFLRNLKPSDLENFHQYRSNPEVTKYQGFDVMNKDQCLNFIEKQKDKTFGEAGEWVQYGIEYLKTKQLIGDCAVKLDLYDVRIAEIGITISDLHQQKGYAKEALIALLNFLFALPEFHRVVEIVDVENAASIQLLKSIGFKKEGHFIENIFFKGKWGSEYQFALLKQDWEKLREK